MSRDTYNSLIQQVHPSDALIQSTKDKMASSITKTHNSRRTRWVISVAAVLCLVLSTTIVAFGSEIAAVIKRITFGDSVVTQVEPYISEDGYESGNWRYINDTVELEVVDDYAEMVRNAEGGDAAGFANDPDSDSFSVRFDNIEDAKRVAPFEMTEPAYLPDDVIGCGGAVIFYGAVEQRSDIHMINFWYDIEVPNEYGIIGGFISIWQEYAGPESNVEITTTLDTEKVMIGDIEAIYQFNSGIPSYPNEYNKYYGWPRCSIIWVQNGFYYELVNSTMWVENLYDLNTMIAIAESIP